MGDLSNLLGDVYGDDGDKDKDKDKDAAKDAAKPTGAPSGTDDAAEDGSTAPPDEGSAPEWSADERLDEAFAEWSPGPPPEAPEAERKVVELGDPGDGDLHEALAAALAAPALEGDATMPAPAGDETVADAETVAATVPMARPWQRSDDDILPAGRRRRGFRLR